MDERESVTGPFAREIASQGIAVNVVPEVAVHAREEGAEYLCCLTAEPVAGGYLYDVSLKEGLTPRGQDEACRAAVARFDRLMEYGPGHDGWGVRSAGHLQLWLRRHDFGELPGALQL